MQNDGDNTALVVIGLLALIVAIVAIVVGLVSPEIRQRLGLGQSANVEPLPTATVKNPVQTPTSILAATSTAAILITPTIISQTARTPSPTTAPTLPGATPYIKGYDTIQAYGTRHILLKKGELIVGTADRFQDDVTKAGQPPCTAFIIKGPIEIDLKIWYGGWNYWANVYDDEMAEVLLQQKVSELQQHQTCPSRGINTVRLP